MAKGVGLKVVVHCVKDSQGSYKTNHETNYLRDVDRYEVERFADMFEHNLHLKHRTTRYKIVLPMCIGRLDFLHKETSST